MLRDKAENQNTGCVPKTTATVVMLCFIVVCFYIKFHCVPYAILEITLLPWPHKRWDCRCVSPYLIDAILGLEPGASRVLGTHTVNWVLFLALTILFRKDYLCVSLSS